MNDIWSKTQNLKFINLFRDYPFIWDKSLEDYRNKPKKELAYDEIAKQMGITKDVAKRKVHSLRTNYCAELRKLLMKKDYKPVWKYFDALRFMFKHENALDDPLNAINRSYVTQAYKDCNSRRASIVPEEDNMVAISYESDYENASDVTCRNDFMQNAEILDSNNQQFSSDVVDFYPVEKFRDEFSVFGEHVANELRLLNDYRSIQLALKCKIMRAVLEANEALHRCGWNKSS